MSHTPSAVNAAVASRKDGRSASQLRPLSYEQSLLHRADGSVRYTQGNTTLIVAVYGPTLASHREEQWDKAALVFTLESTSATAATTAHSSTLSTAALCHHLHATFTPIVLLSLHPRHRISVHIELLSDDGGVLAAVINATMLALLDAGVQCREMIAAVELRVKYDKAAADDKAVTVLLDPSREETEVRESRHTWPLQHMPPAQHTPPLHLSTRKCASSHQLRGCYVICCCQSAPDGVTFAFPNQCHSHTSHSPPHHCRTELFRVALPPSHSAVPLSVSSVCSSWRCGVECVRWAAGRTRVLVCI